MKTIVTDPKIIEKCHEALEAALLNSGEFEIVPKLYTKTGMTRGYGYIKDALWSEKYKFWVDFTTGQRNWGREWHGASLGVFKVTKPGLKAQNPHIIQILINPEGSRYGYFLKGEDGYYLGHNGRLTKKPGRFLLDDYRFVLFKEQVSGKAGEILVIGRIVSDDLVQRLALLVHSIADLLDVETPTISSKLPENTISSRPSVNRIRKTALVPSSGRSLEPSIDIKTIKCKISGMRDTLIRASKDPQFPMEEMDRRCIRVFIEESSTNPTPDNIPDLLDVFFSSCFAYSVVKKYLVNQFKASDLPGEYSLHKGLAAIYNRKDFLDTNNWYPEKLFRIGQELYEQHLSHEEKFSTNKPFNRIILGLIDGSAVMSKKLRNGLKSFYSELDNLTNLSPSERWDYAEEFSRTIRQVGHNLIFDFLKDIGCKHLVKLDYHVVEMLPEIGLTKASNRSNFVKMIELAEELGYTALEFDHIVYQYHRHSKYLREAI